MSAEYDLYLKDHIENLKKGLQWMYENLSNKLIDGEKMMDAMMNADIHDQSKWTVEEYDAYDKYFYGDHVRPPEVQSAFDRAWLHHIHQNPHHWQHWVLLEDDPNLGSFGKVLDMPLEYIYEMIADWWTFSWKNNNLMEMFDWYAAHRDNIRLSAKTRMIVEGILGQIYKVLKMQLVLCGRGDEVKTYIFVDVSEPLIDMAFGQDISNLSHGEELSDEELKKRKYAFPEQRKFPMPDRKHVKSAIKFFNYVDPKDEETLANAILARMKEYGMKLEDLNVGNENRFKKYISENTANGLSHSGIKGQKWGIRNGPPYPLNAEKKLSSVKNLNDIMNSQWEYGVLHDGKHLLDTSDYDWDKNYRTIPLEVLKKEKIGTCWDFVNFQHDALKNMGIDDESYLLFMKKSDDPNDVVTHTFTTFSIGDQQYWLESAAWPKRGVHEINGYKDVIEQLRDMYNNHTHPVEVYRYNPEGLDANLTGQEFIDRIATEENRMDDELEHDDMSMYERGEGGIPQM